MADHFFFGANPYGSHKIVYSEWGDPKNPNVLLCVHGLTRNRHDFDWLAETLSKNYRVICPDLAGRGESDSLADVSCYSYAQDLADLKTLLAHLGVKEIIWLGTFLGGILGMMMASEPENPIKKLILNDIGATVSGLGLKRISKYILSPGVFQSLEAASVYFKKNHLQGIGDVKPDVWENLLKNSIQWSEESRFWKPTYDPVVAQVFYREQAVDEDFTEVWNKVACPVLILRGQFSDLLTEKTAKTMAARENPPVKLVEIPKAGHAPSLTTPEQIKVIQEWLQRG